MKDVIGTCQLGHHATKGGYVLLQYPSGVLVEPIIPISEEEMQSSGVSNVLKRLRNPPKANAKEMSYLDVATKKIMLKIKRDCVLIAISILEERGQEELEIIPLHAGRGWSFETRTEEICQLRLPITNEQFLKIIGDAFEVAT